MDPAPLVVAPAVLVAVLATSGLAKRADTESTANVMRLLRVPRVLRPDWAPAALPWCEIALALGLLVPVATVFTVAAGATLVLMLVYWLLIARALTFDPRPTCGCFGRIGDHQVTGRTLARNSLLAALGAVALGLGLSGHSATGMLTDFGGTSWTWLAGVGVAVAVAVLVVAVDPTPRTVHPTTPQPWEPTGAADEEDDYIRTPIPPAVLTRSSGGPVALSELARERAQLLVFFDCFCASTHATLRLAQGWRHQLGPVGLEVVFLATPALVREGIPENLPADFLHDHLGTVWTQLAFTGSPSALLLGTDGLVAGGPVHGYEEVVEFVGDVISAIQESGYDRPVSDQASSVSPSSSSQASALS